ncbi:MAG: hypothetical protein CMO80_22775 [Verrucomicrobiales bacterium]|nr:hypothetical protein [Verrucomicrobiales bacterium]|tara:strand:- start:907 stop:2454 length:1548 start_codon:yes stop_codon:yes gene_type:complete
MFATLTWQDNTVIVLYLLGMIALGAYLSRRERNDEEYFLAGRRMPWFAVGISVIASILSSLTYLSEPGEIWKAGVTNLVGKMLAIPFEMIFVWLVCIPFLMKFRYTSVYEYLGERFGLATRRVGVGLFILLVVLWMGFVVLATAKALAQISGWSLPLILVVVGTVATIYTMIGGLRAVIWTDVIQVALLIGGGAYAIVHVMAVTGTGLPVWIESSTKFLESQNHEPLPWFSADPTVRATVFTVAFHMCIWHVCTHLSNQMTVQRYFSTTDPKAARRSFVTASLFAVGITLLLAVVGLALVHYYVGRGVAVENELVQQGRYDLIFPVFAMNHLPPGVGGAILAALLAAAMSSIDSGINSIATVITAEMKDGGTARVRLAMKITLLTGAFIVGASYLLNFIPDKWGIVASLPRTFNAVTGPLGGLFLIGMFLPMAGQRAAIIGVSCGMLVSVGIGYSEQLGNLFGTGWPALSFTWVMPCSLGTTLLVAWLVGMTGGRPQHSTAGLTWASRNESSPDK